ncbi:MAG: hypothetical protein QOH29_61 [Actinomycetota bacterium]|nr:hypothetical protein [Jatrophihabitans sp.]MDQ1539335.1 hypothetical protein [Actinomycetota bacterium]
MTTFGHHLTTRSIRSIRHTTRQVWAAIAVLVLAGVITVIVVMNSSSTQHAQQVPPRVGTVQPDQGQAAPIDCRPTNVVHPC